MTVMGSMLGTGLHFIITPEQGCRVDVSSQAHGIAVIPSIYPIEAQMAGRLMIMTKPSSEWLFEDIEALSSMGVGTIVSLLTYEEVHELGLGEEEAACHRRNIEFCHHSTPDRAVPETTAMRKLATDLFLQIQAGRTVAIHCRAGIGRSGILACCILIHAGITADDAIEAVSLARGVPVPDTLEQRDFILAYATSI